MINVFRNRWITLYSGMDSEKFSRLTYTLQKNNVKYREKVIDDAVLAEKSNRRDAAYSAGMFGPDETASEPRPGYIVQIPYRTERAARVSVKYAL
ncbi:MAG: hypothetical protein LBM98_12825 [Oscillospiraceae bacterium]|jgi:hypothetical protein|nr:hypothetical protein [Oscillospiraceae bacterium]